MKKTDDEKAATYRYQDEILSQYLQLSNIMRSVSGQIAIQKHLYFWKFTSIAAFIKSFDYDPFDNLTKKYGNFWYKLCAGRSLTQKSTGHYFLNSVGFSAKDSLNHYLWHLIDQTKSINESLTQLARPLKRQILHPFNKQEKSKYHSFQNFKQSYPKGRENLYNQQSFDSFAALLLIALMQKIKLNHPRPTSAEKFAYAQFLFLFGYKYRTLKKHAMAHKINLLLSGQQTSGQEFSDNKNILIDFEKIRELTKIAEANNELFLDEILTEEIKFFVFAQTDHPCFLKY